MRDPKVDPMEGDILRKNHKEREVDEVTPNSVIYVVDDACSPEVSMTSWRRWAKRATVIRWSERGSEMTNYLRLAKSIHVK